MDRVGVIVQLDLVSKGLPAVFATQDLAFRGVYSAVVIPQGSLALQLSKADLTLDRLGAVSVLNVFLAGKLPTYWTDLLFMYLGTVISQFPAGLEYQISS